MKRKSGLAKWKGTCSNASILTLLKISDDITFLHFGLVKNTRVPRMIDKNTNRDMTFMRLLCAKNTHKKKQYPI